ncbi:ECH_C domain-containing protein [Cephalotus follicularis]|uniref:3-hydroxyisobutyryl-CoA hydrolase n=1 Tax=Cephalotus follicularis TaxID=3775 RepID=A0A1Q3BPH1_CEPFO|nr:ECH_C domain-containing protein [Cephalotus follicularis]
MDSFFEEEDDDQVQFEEMGSVRKVIFNRPQKLNCFTYGMIAKISTSLESYEHDPTVKLVILKGKGTNFCAGGDVARVIYSIVAGHWSFGARFSKKQLSLDYQVATYKKPMVSIMNGIVMGGGAGISMQGTFRIVTETTLFAMPEVKIGFCPDVGSTYFLSRLPGFLGEYLVLTSARMDGADMLACGLATHFVLSKDLPLLEIALCEVNTSDKYMISHIIDRFQYKPQSRKKSPLKRMEVINKCFSRDTVEDILSALLTEEMANKGDGLLIDSIKSMKSASPISLKISLKSMREGRKQNLEQCLIREHTISYHLARSTVTKDFIEGSRALLLDKGRRPRWEPPQLELVTESMVNQHFVIEVEEEDGLELELPPRSNQTQKAKAKL